MMLSAVIERTVVTAAGVSCAVTARGGDLAVGIFKFAAVGRP